MSKLDEGQYFINGKLLEIADKIDWKSFNEAMDENVFQAALKCAKIEELKHRLRFIHLHFNNDKPKLYYCLQS